MSRFLETWVEDGFYRLEVDMVDTRLLDGWLAMWKEDAGMRLIERTPIPTEDNI